jgi:hypothetical protein
VANDRYLRGYATRLPRIVEIAEEEIDAIGENDNRSETD